VIAVLAPKVLNEEILIPTYTLFHKPIYLSELFFSARWGQIYFLTDRKSLEDWLPRDKWTEINWLLGMKMFRLWNLSPLRLYGVDFWGNSEVTIYFTSKVESNSCGHFKINIWT
jgi:hypothetical protein